MVAWIVAAGLGAGVGLAELVTRYRDEPRALWTSVSFWLYILLNAGASATALELAHVFGWNFGMPQGAGRHAVQALVAGLGAMTLFRSSFLNLKVGSEDVGIGPSSVLTSLLAVVDRSVDRRRAAQRSRLIASLMDGVSYKKSGLALSMYCIQLMQNLPLDEQEKLRNSVEAVGLTQVDEEMKMLNLGLLLLNAVGPAVLTAAIHDLGDKIKGLPHAVCTAGRAHAARSKATADVPLAFEPRSGATITQNIRFSGQAGIRHPPAAFRVPRLPLPLVRRHRMRSGTGKTTLMRILLGLTRADGGTMSLLGFPVPAERKRALARVGAIVDEPGSTST